MYNFPTIRLFRDIVHLLKVYSSLRSYKIILPLDSGVTLIEVPENEDFVLELYSS